MFSRASTAVLAFFVAVAVAGPVARTDTCTTGSMQCCKIDQLTGNIPLVNAQCVGIVGSQQCNGQVACCSNNNFNGLANVGCTPINLNL